MVDELDSVHPKFRPFLGAVVAVSMIQNGNEYRQEADALGAVVGPGNRLSGSLPWCAAYSSSTPGNNVILFGEDRNDVLGFTKMPAAQRWILGAPQEPRGLDTHAFFGDPIVYFAHRNQTFVDQDVSKAVSTQTVNPATAEEQKAVHDPGKRLNGGPGIYAPPPTNYRMDGTADVIQPTLYRNPYFNELRETFRND